MLPRLRQTLLVAALAAAALAVTASASSAAGTHRLNIQKQESSFTVAPGDASTSARCASGTAVLSGSMRVDNVPGGKPSDVRVTASTPGTEPTAADQTIPTTWYWSIRNDAPKGSQPAQVKLFVVCLKLQTESGDGQQHSLYFGPRQDPATTLSGTAASRDVSVSCVPGLKTGSYIPTDAGFVFDPPDRARDLAYSGTDRDDLSVPLPEWDFTVANTTGTTPFGFYQTLWCLSNQTTRTSPTGHRHALGVSLQYATVPLTRTTGNGTVQVQVSCPSDSFGIEGGFYVSPNAIGKGAALTGIEPQDGKTIFSFVNPNGVSGEYVDAQVLCLAKVTGTDDGPAPVSNGTCFVASSARAMDMGHMGHAQCAQKLTFRTRTRAATVRAHGTAQASLACASSDQILVGGAVGGAGARSVTVTRSAYDAGTGAWSFAVRNPTGKGARVTLAVKCLTGSAGEHTLVAFAAAGSSCPSSAVAIRSSTVGGLAARPAVGCLLRQTTSQGGYHHTLNVKQVAATVRVTGAATRTLACPRTYEAVTPAAKLGGRARLTSSAMAAGRWTFGLTGRGSAKLGLTCVQRGTTKAEMDHMQM